MQTTSGQISLLARHTNEFGCRSGRRKGIAHRIRRRRRLKDGEIGTRLNSKSFSCSLGIKLAIGTCDSYGPLPRGSLPSFASPGRPQMEPEMRYGDRDGTSTVGPAGPGGGSSFDEPAVCQVASQPTNNARG